MRQIVIYVEGGGDNSQCRSEIRNGLDALLRKQKQAAQRKNIGWKLVPCGSFTRSIAPFSAPRAGWCAVADTSILRRTILPKPASRRQKPLRREFASDAADTTRIGRNDTKALRTPVGSRSPC